MNFFNRLLIVVVAVCIPVICIMSACNVVFRMPDLYIYEFNKMQISDEIDLEIKDDELGSFFSEFMTGKEKEFDLFAEYRDREQSVFGPVEQGNMEHARNLLRITLYILGGALFFSAICYWFLLFKKKKYELRAAFKGGILGFALIIVAMSAMFHFNATRSYFYQKIFINPFGADDVLPLMLTGQFAQMGLIAVSVVGLVFLVILASVTWRLTKPRRMFGDTW